MLCIGLATSLLASLWLVYWLVASVLGGGRGGAILILVPTAAIGVSVAVYAAGMNWGPAYAGWSADRVAAFERWSRTLVFTGMLALPAILAVVSAVVWRRWAEAGLFTIFALATAPWAIRKIGRELQFFRRLPRS